MESSKCIIENEKIIFFINEAEVLESQVENLDLRSIKAPGLEGLDSDKILSGEITVTISGTEITLSIEGRIKKLDDGQTVVEFTRSTDEFDDHIGNLIELEKMCA